MPPARPHFRVRSDPRGFTLLELVVVLSLVALLIGLGAPIWRGTVDRWAVRSVRDRTLAALHRTRVEARAGGGARLEVDGARGRVQVWGPDSLLWEDRSPAEHGVDISLPGGAAATTLTFDALGLGVVASRTLVFRRGAAEARLVVSARGRGTRR
jgi:prepilin-type N-terminal cleavage/methylation domain-containing protein